MLVALVIFYFSGYLLSVQGCTYGELRLVGGHSSTEGRVEICIYNAWRTICDDGWDDDNAKVVCRQLGYSTKGAKSYHRAYFGQGSGSIYRNYVVCLGSESSLLQCYHSPIGHQRCTHREDVGVSCLILSPGAIAGITISGLVVIAITAVCIVIIVICAIVLIKKGRAKLQSQSQHQAITDTAPSRVIPPASTLSTSYHPALPNSMSHPQMTTNQPKTAAGTAGAQGAVPQYIPLTEPTMTQLVVPQSVPQQSQTIAPTDHELPQVQSIANEDEAPIVPPTEEEPKEYEGVDEADDAPLLTS